MTDFPHLYAIVNIDSTIDPVGYTNSLHDAGISLIQLRAKSISADRYRAIATEVINSFADQKSPQIIINDSPQIAYEVGATGVHLGQTDSSVSEARELLGPEAIIGLSTHNKAQLIAAPFELLSYVAIGPIFRSSTKNGHAPEIGEIELKKLTPLSPIPVVAIGGITTQNAQLVYGAGVHCVAVIRDLSDSKNLRETVINYQRLKSIV